MSKFKNNEEEAAPNIYKIRSTQDIFQIQIDYNNMDRLEQAKIISTITPITSIQ